MQARAYDSSGGNFAEACLYVRTFLLKVPKTLKTLLITNQWRESVYYAKSKVVVHCVMKSTVSYICPEIMALKRYEVDSADLACE